MSIRYKDYDLDSLSMKLTDSDEWMTTIDIAKLSPHDYQTQPFHITDTFKTKEEADSYALNLGIQIIDGKHPNLKLSF